MGFKRMSDGVGPSVTIRQPDGDTEIPRNTAGFNTRSTCAYGALQTAKAVRPLKAATKVAASLVPEGAGLPGRGLFF
jgi:hypothetical protein